MQLFECVSGESDANGIDGLATYSKVTTWY